VVAVKAKKAPGATVDTVLAALKSQSSKKIRDEMGPRYGVVTDKAFGVPMARMLAIAKEIGCNHELAAGLWDTGWYEARMVACMIDDPARVTPAQMDRWRRDFDNWGICDTVCFKLFDRTPHVFAKVPQWSKLNDEFGKRAAFALLACAALHGNGSQADFLRALPLVERAASDERNFVKKGVSWALRAMGEKGAPATKAAALALARKLAASDDAAKRWVGKDALKSLVRKRAVQKRA
jgi:3-methyladenine DNA glycosylase AlkD